MPGLSEFFRGQPRLTRRWRAEIGDHVVSLAWSPRGDLLAAASVSGPIHLFDPSGQARGLLKGHGFGTAMVSWRSDGTMLASAGQDGKVRLWDVYGGTETAALAGGASWVEHVNWHPSQDLLASAAGKKLRLWSADGKLVREYPDHAATI
jgi:WD40 repeat protein